MPGILVKRAAVDFMIIENKKYTMVNAGMYFGNSGGALFLAETGELIGVPSRLTGLPMGFGSMDMVLFMGFAAHPSRLYEFARHEHMEFLIDPEKTWYDAVEDRKTSEKQSTIEMQVEAEKALHKK